MKAEMKTNSNEQTMNGLYMLDIGMGWVVELGCMDRK